MRQFDILLPSDLDGGMETFKRDEVEIRFHRVGDIGELPLLEGTLWAFVDWVQPEMSGLEACRRLRCDPITADSRITMVFDEDDQEAKRRALRQGADDYILGPVNRNSLLDRVLLHGFSGAGDDSARLIQLGDLTIDFAGHRASWKGKRIPLMPNELNLLIHFVENDGRLFSRRQLIAAMGKNELPLDERTVDVWIGRLRRALRNVGAGNPLRTVRSLGYVYDG